MNYKKKIIILLLLIVVLSVIQYALRVYPRYLSFYDMFIFQPWQYVRNVVFGYVPFSVGDILYLLAVLAIVTLVIRWIVFLVRLRTHNGYLLASIIHTIITFEVIYLLFILGWGANYYKPTLTNYWELKVLKEHRNDSSTVREFDTYLVAKLNEYAPHYHSLPFKEVNRRAQLYYRQYTNTRSKLGSLNVKPSIFGYLMQNFAIQGYYNPFTGESQVNRFLPQFMLPFVVCHEMAHQAGIAAEDDANLLAYALGTATNDTAFKYSCYFNIWLYAHNRMYRHDTTMANKLELTLNKLTLAQVDTLEDIRRRYNGDMSHYSSKLYDGYLKMHHQKDGIRSYGNVAISAWAWEEHRKLFRNMMIMIP
ncbi:MAG: DUF3810 domain-containing protein [Flavipsychrobacter sp.]|nr:DUF3810 domain-containing protein [Flavipsychrobacter sp.]